MLADRTAISIAKSETGHSSLGDVYLTQARPSWGIQQVAREIGVTRKDFIVTGALLVS
jgi:hypothetical protein